MATKYYDIVQSDDISVPQSRVEGLLEHTYIPTKKGSGSGDDDGGSGRTLYIQSKTVTSSFKTETYRADDGYDYLGSVKVLEMPISRETDTDGGIIVTIGA